MERNRRKESFGGVTMTVNLTSFHERIASYLTDHDLDPHGKLFQLGTCGYDWELQGKIATCSPGYHEELLEEFLGRDPGDRRPSSGQVLVLIGEVGVGKSTSIKRALRNVVGKPRRCSLCQLAEGMCEQEPRVIDLDSADVTPKTDLSRFEIESVREEFWNYIAARLGEHCGNLISTEEEVSRFWEWCLEKSQLLQRSLPIHRFLISVRPLIARYLGIQDLPGFTREDALQSLLRERQAFMQTIHAQDLSWYRVFLLRFILEHTEHPCRCTYTILDNVDHLHPELQRIAVDFVLYLADALKSRTIIPIRPLTWARSISGHILVRTEMHYSPDIIDVIERRITAFVKNEKITQQERDALLSLTNLLIGKTRDRLLSVLLRATSGLSVRWALRNLENMLESPILAKMPASKDSVSGMRISDLARAFFFGNRNGIIPWAFEHLYSVGGDDRIEYALVKPRILDLLIRAENGRGRVMDIFNRMMKFGHQTEVIRQALEDLLVGTRPLLWSEEGFQCEDETSKGRIMVTPIGRGYYNDLFGEVFYDEVCLARSLESSVGLRMVYDFHQRLTEQDLLEAAFCYDNFAACVYLGFYPIDMIGLSVLHARKVVRGIQKRARRDDIFFDPRRDEWISARIREILNGIELIELPAPRPIGFGVALD